MGGTDVWRRADTVLLSRSLGKTLIGGDEPEDRDRLWGQGDLIFRRYRVSEYIAAGGMGDVYVCLDEQTQEKVVLKTLKMSRRGLTPPEVRRVASEFLVEARRSLRLGEHACLVPLLSAEVHQHAHLVLISEYIAGKPGVGPTLAHWLRGGKRIEIPRAARWIQDACAGLEHMMERAGLVHCDIKPPNLFVDATDRMRVGDFGIATRAGLPSRGGTCSHMAPEQFYDPKRPSCPVVDQRTDIYALGCVLYQMLCGQLPLPPHRQHAAGLTPQIWEFHHKNTEPPPPRRFNPEIPRSLEEVILRCLAKAPDDRHEDVLALSGALNAWVPPEKPRGLVSGSPRTAAGDIFDEARSRDATGDKEGALRCYGELVQIEPFATQQSVGWCNMGRVLGDLGRIEESLNAFNRALQIDPTDVHARFGIGICMQRRGSWEEALAAFDQVLEIEEDYGDAWTARAEALRSLGELDEAVEAYQKAVELGSDESSSAKHIPLANWAALLVEKGQHEEALQRAEQALRLKPDYVPALLNACGAHLGLARRGIPHHLSMALDRAEEALRVEPDNVECVAARGIALGNWAAMTQDRELFARALEDLTRVTGSGSKDPLVWLSRGMAQAECGQFREAIGSLDQALRLGLRNAEMVATAARCRAMCQEFLGPM